VPTTIRLDGDLLRQAKRRALETGRTLNAVIEDALRAALQSRRGPKHRFVELPRSGAGGTLPGVDLDTPARCTTSWTAGDPLRRQRSSLPEIFTDLCRAAGARGNIVPDAYFAALALESGSEWQTTDRDYSRFPGLRWRHPLETGL
jgi:hypothetical protein